MFCKNLQNSCLAVARHDTSISLNSVYSAIAASNKDSVLEGNSNIGI
jgi:hypothetical protein